MLGRESIPSAAGHHGEGAARRPNRTGHNAKAVAELSARQPVLDLRGCPPTPDREQVFDRYAFRQAGPIVLDVEAAIPFQQPVATVGASVERVVGQLLDAELRELVPFDASLARNGVEVTEVVVVLQLAQRLVVV